MRQAEESKREVSRLQKVLADGALEYEAAIAKGHQKDALATEILQLRKRDEVMMIFFSCLCCSVFCGSSRLGCKSSGM